MQKLAGKIALVAGAGRNNGKAVALAFAREGALGPFGIRANLIAPFNIENVRLNPEWYPDKVDGQYSAADVAVIPLLKRVGKPQEVANVAVFLASEQSSYVTGDRIIRAGGRYI